MKYLKLSDVSYSYGLLQLHLTFLHLCELANFHGLIHGILGAPRSLGVLGVLPVLGGKIGPVLGASLGALGELGELLGALVIIGALCTFIIFAGGGVVLWRLGEELGSVRSIIPF